LDIAKGEATEKELDALIRRRHERRVLSEGERVELEAWQITERLEAARKREENCIAWCSYYRRIAGALYARAEDYIVRPEKLEGDKSHENGHQEETA
jgi:hypothetical protein